MTYSEVSAIEKLDETPPAQQPGEDSEPTTIDDQIAQAEEAGDWLSSGRLKVEKARQQAEGATATAPTPEPTATTPEPTQQPPTEEYLRAEISDAEANADYFELGLAKAKLVNKRDPLNPDVGAVRAEDQVLEQRIHDAEGRGDWAESLRLKTQRAGVRP